MSVSYQHNVRSVACPRRGANERIALFHVQNSNVNIEVLTATFLNDFSDDNLTQKKNDKFFTLDLVLFSHCANTAKSHNVIKIDEEIDFIRFTLLEGAKVRELRMATTSIYLFVTAGFGKYSSGFQSSHDG